MPMKTAILITSNRDDAIREAGDLCRSAGYRVVHTMEQRFLNRPKYGIGDQVLDRLEKIADASDPDVIVYDEILKPSQNYNLASRLHRNILDREALILEIFESRASSSESKLQVKLAQMRYEMSRAKEKVRLAKMGEQPGFMGIGKFEADVYTNDIRHRMNTVKSKLGKAGKQRDLHRQARKKTGFTTISLAGYTSAGKTTLFNRLTGEHKERSDELFTTLSTTTRRVTANQKAYLLSDTVGFISKLPAYMVEAFRSTLEELLHTDAVLLIVDISDSAADLQKKFQSCKKTLTEIGVQPDRIIFALNKSDLASRQEIVRRAEELGLAENKKWVPVSAVTGYNLARLMRLVEDMVGGPHDSKAKKAQGAGMPYED